MCLLGAARLGSTPPLLLLSFGRCTPLQFGVLEIESSVTADRHYCRHQVPGCDSTLYGSFRDPQVLGDSPRRDKSWLVGLFVLGAFSWHVPTISSSGADSQFLTLIS